MWIFKILGVRDDFITGNNILIWIQLVHSENNTEQSSKCINFRHKYACFAQQILLCQNKVNGYSMWAGNQIDYDTHQGHNKNAVCNPIQGASKLKSHLFSVG